MGIQVFTKDQIHIVDGDRLVYDPFPEVQRAEAFLGVAHKIRPDNFVYNSTKGFYCVRLPSPSVNPVNRDDGGVIQSAMSNSAINAAAADKCLNESKGRRHPQVDPAVVQTLRRFYAPYNRQFYKMAGRDFGWPEV